MPRGCPRGTRSTPAPRRSLLQAVLVSGCEVCPVAELSREMEDVTMTWSSCEARPTLPTRCVSIALLSLLITLAGSNAQAQDQTGSIGGRVVDDMGTPLVGAQVAIPGSSIGTQTRANGEYVLPRV